MSFPALNRAVTWLRRIFKRQPQNVGVTVYPSALGLEVAAHLDEEYPGWRRGDWTHK